MNLKELIMHSAIATAALALSSKPIDVLVDKTNLNPENKTIGKTVLKTGVLGVFIEESITAGLRNGGEKYELRQRVASKALTAGSLMLSTYLASKYMKPRANPEDYQNNNHKDDNK